MYGRSATVPRRCAQPRPPECTGAALLRPAAMLQPIFFYALKAWSKTRMLHEARTVHIRPLRARATMLSHQPPTSPLPLPVEERKGVGGKVRAALTPGPSPALRERGDLV